MIGLNLKTSQNEKSGSNFVELELPKSKLLGIFLSTIFLGFILKINLSFFLKIPTVDLDFPELEHSFPNFHHQLFKPLEPQPDFDFSSFSSGISQDSRDFYQVY